MFKTNTLQKDLTGLYRWDGNNPEEVTDEFFTWLQSVHYTQHGVRPHKSEAMVRCSLQKEPCQLKMHINLSSWLSEQLLPESWSTASGEPIPSISGGESHGHLNAGLRAWPAQTGNASTTFSNPPQQQSKCNGTSLACEPLEKTLWVFSRRQQLPCPSWLDRRETACNHGELHNNNLCF